MWRIISQSFYTVALIYNSSGSGIRLKSVSQFSSSYMTVVSNIARVCIVQFCHRFLLNDVFSTDSRISIRVVAYVANCSFERVCVACLRPLSFRPAQRLAMKTDANRWDMFRLLGTPRYSYIALNVGFARSERRTHIPWC